MTERASVKEPDIYAPESPHSYFRDLVAFAQPLNADHGEARARLEQYAHGLSHDENTTAGRQARKVWREASRARDMSRTDAQYRAMSSGGASGGALVTPIYLTEMYAPFHEYVPAVADACTQVPLPAYGMQVNIPALTAGDPDGIQGSENALTEADMTGTLRTATLDTFAGYTTISQQLYDQSGPTAFDLVVFAQLRASMDQKVSLAAINAMTAAATTNLTRAAFTDMSSIWSDVNHAASTLESPTGLALPATHFFSTPTRFRWFASQVDTQKRPIWQPDGSTPPDPMKGFMGYTIAATGVYADASIPASGSNDVMLVANPASTILPLGEPVAQILPETAAGSLGVVVRLYRYGVPVVRYPAGCATITGAAYPTAVTWA